MTCPGDVELSRALTAGAGPELAAHLGACAGCRTAWDGARAAIDLARELAIELPPASRREEVRTAVLASAAGRAGQRSRRAWLVPAIAGAAAAGVAGTLALAPSSPPPLHAHGTVRPQPGARYAVRSIGPDEIIELGDGAIDVEVEPLHPGERFRVVVGAAELEVRGTAFTVAASAEHLIAVTVARGRVDLTSGAASASLTAGQSWRAAAVATLATPAPASASPAPVEHPPVTASTTTPPPPPAGHAAPPRPHRIAEPPTLAISPPPVLAPPPVPAPPPRPHRVAAAPHRDSELRSSSSPPAPAPPVAPAPPPDRSPAEVSYDDAWTALRTGDFTRAAVGFARVVLLAPDSPLVEDASFWRAVALARGGRGAEAVSAFHDFLDGYARSPRAGEASAMLGWLLIDARDLDQAARWFTAAAGDPSPAVRGSARAGLDALARRKR